MRKINLKARFAFNFVDDIYKVNLIFVDNTAVVIAICVRSVTDLAAIGINGHVERMLFAVVVILAVFSELYSKPTL